MRIVGSYNPHKKLIVVILDGLPNLRLSTVMTKLLLARLESKQTVAGISVRLRLKG